MIVTGQKIICIQLFDIFHEKILQQGDGNQQMRLTVKNSSALKTLFQNSKTHKCSMTRKTFKKFLCSSKTNSHTLTAITNMFLNHMSSAQSHNMTSSDHISYCSIAI